jgi:hypothetical protein
MDTEARCLSAIASASGNSKQCGTLAHFSGAEAKQALTDKRPLQVARAMEHVR